MRKAFRILPFESRQTAPWAEKDSLTAVPKLILKELASGGDHFSIGGEESPFQAKKWSKSTFLIERDKTRASVITPSCTTLFLLSHSRSHVT